MGLIDDQDSIFRQIGLVLEMMEQIGMIGQEKLARAGLSMQATPEIPVRKEGLSPQGTIVLQLIKIGLVAHLELEFIQVTRFRLAEPDQDLHLVAVEEAVGVIPLQGLPKGIQFEKMSGGFQGLNR